MMTHKRLKEYIQIENHEVVRIEGQAIGEYAVVKRLLSSKKLNTK